MKAPARLLFLLILSATFVQSVIAQTSPRFPNVISTAADPLLTNLTIPANAATNGMWSSTFAWPIVGIHSTVMPDGRILTEGTAPNTTGVQDGRTLDFWTPQLGFAATSHLELPNAQNVDSFCGTVSVLPSTGNVMLSGGGGNDGYTSFLSTLVNPATTSVNGSGSSLAAQRWYSTMITLSDGRALIGGGGTPYAIVGGYANPASILPSISVTPELYDPAANTWTTLMNGYSLDAFGPTNNRAWYPRMWLAPDGGVFGISTDKVWYMDTKAFNTTTLRNFKTTVDNTLLPNVGPTSTAVMYDTGKILQVGGNGYNNGYPSNSSPYATIFDITSPLNPIITDTARMNFPRQWANSLVMPDGQVLVTGGTTFADSSGVNNVPAVEMWNPQTGTWKVGASAANYRGYHSSTVLLQNGTVLSLGGGVPGPVQNNNGEVYYPPYLFTQSGNTSVLASRPTIVSVDTLNSTYNQPVNLEMADNSYVAEASLIGLSSTTHSFNTFQRRIKLTISQYGTVLTATMPQSANTAPPGYYLLTVLNGARVPSKAIIIALNAKAVAQQGVNNSTPPAPLPGNRIAQGFVKVAAGSDGTLVGISATNNLLYISKSDGTAKSAVNFTPMPSFSAKDVAVLSASSVYAIGMDDNVWHYWNGVWTQIGVIVKSVAASPDGTVVVVNRDYNTVWKKVTDDNQQNWQNVANVAATRVALVNKNSLYFIGQDGNAYRSDNVNAPVKINSGISDITATSDGSIDVVTYNGAVQTKTGDNTTQNWTTLTGAIAVSRIGSPNQNTVVLTYASGDVYLQSTASSTSTTSSSVVSITCSAGVTYNGAAQTPCTATATGSGGLNQAVQVMYANNTNAGMATASAKFAGDATHTGSSSNISFAIAPAPLTATAGSYTGVYDGNTHAPSACQISTNSGGITCSNQPATVGPNVGSGTITSSINGANANYTVTTVNGAWAINPLPVTVTAGSYSGTYDGSSHVPSACASTYTGVTCANSPASVGPALGTGTVVPVASGSTPNYVVTSVNGTWSITAATTTTTGSNQIGQGFLKVAAGSDGTLVGISATNNLLYISKSDGTAKSAVSFTPMPSFSAKDVAVLSATSVYAIGMDDNVWHYWNGVWTQIGVIVKSIAASPDGTIVVVNRDYNSVWKKLTDDNQQNWQNVANVTATRVALVNKNSLYFIGQDGNAYRSDNVNLPVQINSGVSDITATYDGSIDVVTSTGTVQTKTGDNTTQNWTTLTGVSGVSRIGAPNQNTVVLTYGNGNAYLQATKNSAATGPNQIGQGFLKVAAGSDGTLVGISATNNLLYISKSDGTAKSSVSFTAMPSFSAKDIAVLNANSVYAIGMDGNIWHYWKGAWTQIGTTALSIAASPDGTIVIANSYDNTIYEKPTDDNQQNWYWLPGRATRVALVNKSSLYFIGQDGNAYRSDNVNAPVKINSGVSEITATSDGSIGVVTTAGTVQTKTGDNTTQNWTTLTGASAVSRIGAPNQNTVVLTYTNGNVYLLPAAN